MIAKQILGWTGGQVWATSDEEVVILSDSAARVQKCHILLGHVLCEIVEQELDLV